jgi:tetratricopeptide (TPR) repeat protein
LIIDEPVNQATVGIGAMPRFGEEISYGQGGRFRPRYSEPFRDRTGAGLGECDVYVPQRARAHRSRGHASVSLVRRGRLSSDGRGRGVAGLLELKTKTGITAQLTYLAEAQALDGALTDALGTIEDALEANPDEAVTRPDAFTLRGERQLKSGKRELAEADFREAITLAQKTNAKTMELRATMSLARLLRHSNRRNEARAILAEIYGWFTEGFDTSDLRDAKALLEELC